MEWVEFIEKVLAVMVIRQGQATYETGQALITALL